MLELGLLELSGITNKPARCGFLPGREYAKPTMLHIELIYKDPANVEKLAGYFKDTLHINKMKATFCEPDDDLFCSDRSYYYFDIDGKEALEKILPDFKRNFTRLDPQFVANCQVKSRDYLAKLNIPSYSRFLTSEFTLWSKVIQKKNAEFAAEIIADPTSARLVPK